MVRRGLSQTWTLTMADALSEMLAQSLVGGDADLEAAVRDELIRGQFAEQALALAEQERIAQANHQIERAFTDGLGQCTMAVDIGLYTYWEQRMPGCWSDPDFRKRMARDNPELRVKSRSKKIQVSFANSSRLSAGGCEPKTGKQPCVR